MNILFCRQEFSVLYGYHFKCILGQSRVILRRIIKYAAGSHKVLGVFDMVPYLCPVRAHGFKSCYNQIKRIESMAAKRAYICFKFCFIILFILR